ncbi:hypothetical protein CPT_Momento_054 [Burkholderia phage Momento]|uniref:Uncharacterized protein n=1 Tax=Burkholderia phage Momento TaxID=2924902 RepID=A0AAE9K4V5_9CAUD|nr:hypothetical protein CPT_Momento_054 [Burkholderia phage Momento]
MRCFVCRHCERATHHSRPDDWCARNFELSVSEGCVVGSRERLVSRVWPCSGGGTGHGSLFTFGRILWARAAVTATLWTVRLRG